MGLVPDLHRSGCWNLDAHAGHFIAFCNPSNTCKVPTYEYKTESVAGHKRLGVLFLNHETPEDLLI